MKNKTAATLIVTLLLILAALWGVVGMIRLNQKKEPYHISVVLSDSYHDSWGAAKEGMEQAAREYDIKLNYLYTGIYETLSEQRDAIIKEQENGADGVITKLLSGARSQEYMDTLCERSAVVFLDSVEPYTPEENYICPDYEQIGKQLAQCILQDYPQKSISIGIILGKEISGVADMQLNALTEELKENGMEITWSIELEQNATLETITQRLSEEDKVDVLIGLENEETELIIDYVTGPKAKSSKASVYGTGYSEKLIYYLDNGYIKHLVVPNEFNIGYKCVERLVQILKKEAVESQEMIGYTVVDQYNLYDEENQKMLFPIVQ